MDADPSRIRAKASSRHVEDFGEVLGDNVAAGVLLDRFLHHAVVVQLTGRSFRLYERQRRQAAVKDPVSQAAQVSGS